MKVFLMLTFPVITSVYFYIVFVFKFLLLARFPLMLSPQFWHFSLSVRDSLNLLTQIDSTYVAKTVYTRYVIPTPLAKLLWFFVPTTYTREEFVHKVLISFCFTMYSYVIAPVYYLALSSWLRYVSILYLTLFFNQLMCLQVWLQQRLLYLQKYITHAIQPQFNLCYCVSYWIWWCLFPYQLHYQETI